MEDFKTYKPLLSAIKNEYDLYVSYLQQQIAEMEPLKVNNRYNKLEVLMCCIVRHISTLLKRSVIVRCLP